MATTAEGAQQTPAKPIAVRTSGMKLDMPSAQPRLSSKKAASVSVGIMSPVNQNGCFEFDRIIKVGNVVKRTRKTKASTASL
jgi:hypothetical protein